MIDHLLGSPNPSWKRAQVFLVIVFWVWRILAGNPEGPRVLWLRRANRLLKQFTPWQLIVSTLTGVYAVRNLDKILGLGAPEPLANLYSPAYYRATWISTGLDAGFATAMTIRPKWLRDLCSVLFSVYYIIYANEADEKLRKFRAVPTVEMLRATWNKTTNPYIRALTYLPRVTIRRKLLLPRPPDSPHTRPIAAWLFFAPPAHHLARATELILDLPGGGFISMTPEHHEERLRMWAVRTGKPVLALDYGKAPEYPYPYAIDECFDAYRVLADTGGQLVGMSGAKFSVIISGDSAGAHLAVNVMLKILETQLVVPRPVALMLNYAALDFNFASWMTPADLRVLRTEQSSGHLRGLGEERDHLKHVSPLSMGGARPLRRRSSWRDALRGLTSATAERERPGVRQRKSMGDVDRKAGRAHQRRATDGVLADAEPEPDEEEDEDEDAETVVPAREEEKPLQARVRFDPGAEAQAQRREQERAAEAAQQAGAESVQVGTRLTMTSRTGYFQDRIISPSMMRSMAILYIGPHRNPDFATDYHISPLLAPARLLAQFPPVLLSCGEKDPFVDDTVIFAGRVRAAKRARLAELDAALAGRASPQERALRRERDALAGQTDADWVRMEIYGDWSHGYLQMPTLIRAARAVIYELADWLDGAFAAHAAAAAKRSAKRASPPRREALALAIPAESSASASAASASETEVDEALTFSPRRRSPPAAFAGVPRGDELRALDGGRAGSVPRAGAGTPGKAGGTISESELMRRRRLLDAHLIASVDGIRQA